jgi:hypothetical protein
MEQEAADNWQSSYGQEGTIVSGEEEEERPPVKVSRKWTEEEVISFRERIRMMC